MQSLGPLTSHGLGCQARSFVFGELLPPTGSGREVATQAADIGRKDYERILQREEEPELFITIPTGLKVGSTGERPASHSYSRKTRQGCPVRPTYRVRTPQTWQGGLSTRVIDPEQPCNYPCTSTGGICWCKFAFSG